jgi:hypothetical protein
LGLTIKTLRIDPSYFFFAAIVDTIMEAKADESPITLGNGQNEDSLCDRCKSLNLGVDKFIVNPPSPTAHALQQEDVYEPKRIRNFSAKTRSTQENFATFKNLCDNEISCAFCRLARGAMERYSGGMKNKINDDTICSLCWEIYGRETSKSISKNKTRRIRLSWIETTGHTQHVFLLFVAPRNPSHPNSDVTSRYQRKIQFLGREFADQKKKQALIKSWIDLCLEQHTEDCRVTHGTADVFKALIKETYFGVIDVADMQLKSLPLNRETDRPEPFVALSYVWGKNNNNEPPYTTTRKNVMTHIRHGGLETAWDKLPRTLQDAIRLVSLLNYRYIWIDSLCIVQDSQSSWQLNAQAMHLVYGHAEFTICAADGHDATSGSVAANDILFPSSSQRSKAVETQPMSEDVGNGVRLMAIRPLEATISDSEWNQRAWTFQERVMSRRCVIFAEGRVYFQCRAASFSQDVYADGGNNSLSLEHSSSPLRTLLELQQRPFWFYLTYVRMYTGRQLTKPRDIIAAYKAIDWLLNQYMGSVSIFGLPTSHFDLALLWTPRTSIRLRRARKTAHRNRETCTQDALGNCMCHVEERSFEGIELPTWSWSGWMDGTIEYDTPILEGCLSNVHEWLRRHTWIQWYARDEKGHLRPLCDIMSQNAEPTRPVVNSMVDSDNRWKGYPKLKPFLESGPLTHDTSTSGVGEDSSLTSTSTSESGGSQENSRRRSLSPSSSSSGWRTNHLFEERNAKEGEDKPRGGVIGKTIQALIRFVADRWSTERAMVVPSSLPTPVQPSSVARHRPQPSFPPPLPMPNKTTWVRPGSEDSRRSVDNVVYDTYRPIPIPKGSSSRSCRRRGSQSNQASSNSNSSESGSESEDNYGRLMKRRLKRRLVGSESGFQAILPDNPFRVIYHMSSSGPCRKSRKTGKRSGPSTFMPILQFFTWSAELCIAIRETLPGGTGLCQCDILDKAGDWCGAITLDKTWISDKTDHIFYFIALSDAQNFTLKECPVWTYYIPKERDKSEWDLYYVMLLQRNIERGLWERVAIGKSFKAAFQYDSWNEIKLG